VRKNLANTKDPLRLRDLKQMIDTLESLS